MDTITHLAIGACLGAATSGKAQGKGALVVGAVAQVLPDIDTVSVLWQDPASSVVSHRYLTHSILFVIVAAYALAMLAHHWIFPELNVRAWVKFFFLQFCVHLLLDSFNVYGVAWAAPFSTQRISFNALFVVDPFLTLPLLIVTLLSWLNWVRHQHWAWMGVLMTSVYLSYALVNKQLVNRVIENNLSSQSRYEYLSTPTPFNVWLWYIVVKKDDGFLIGYRSVFDDGGKIEFISLPRQDSLLLSYHSRSDVQKLIRFSNGYYAAQSKADTLVFSDLRFGQIHGWLNPQSSFVFYYIVKPNTADNRTVMQRGRAKGWTWRAIRKMADRILSRKESDV